MCTDIQSEQNENAVGVIVHAKTAFEKHNEEMCCDTIQHVLSLSSGNNVFTFPCYTGVVSCVMEE